MTPTLQSIASGCWNGASNPNGILHALADAMKLRAGPFTPADKLDLRIIVDHLSCILPPLSEHDPVFDLCERYRVKGEAPHAAQLQAA